MEKFWEKFDQYLFDIVGIILPGLVLIMLLDFLGFWPEVLELTLQKDGPTFEYADFLALATLVILSFLAGHTVKHASITLHSFAKAWLDKGLYRLPGMLCNGLYAVYIRIWEAFASPQRVNWLREKHREAKEWRQTKIYNSHLASPFKKFIVDLLYFETKSYGADYKPYEEFAMKKLQEIDPILDFRETDNTSKLSDGLYKMSDSFSRNQQVKTLKDVHLAKYNCYRSLWLVFLIGFIACVFHIFKEWGQVPEKFIWVGILSFIMMFTFHYKFKRYWGLCATEALMSLFYSLLERKTNQSHTP